MGHGPPWELGVWIKSPHHRKGTLLQSVIQGFRLRQILCFIYSIYSHKAWSIAGGIMACLIINVLHLTMYDVTI
jgi:hypothetical protein